MRKFFVFLLAAVVFVAAGVGIFIATFDVNRFKPQILQALEKALGCPVRIESLKLGWTGGVVLQINKLAIYSNAQSMSKPAATLEKANVFVRLGPLLQKKLEVVSLTLVRPRFNIIKEESGSVRVNGLNLSPQAPAVSKSGPQSSAQLVQSFSIDIIKIDGGEVGYVDRSEQSALKKIAVKDVDVLIKNISFTSPVDFEAKFSLFSNSQNISLRGRALVMSPAGPYTLQNFKMENNLGAFKFSEMSESFPSIKSSGLVEPLRGVLKTDIERLVVSSQGLGDLNASLSLKEGRFKMQSLKSALDNVTLEANIHKNDLNLKKLSADFAKGILSAQAVSKNYVSAASQTRIGLKAEQLKLEELLPIPKPGRPQLQGNLSMVFNGAATGLSWSSISNTLNGSGHVTLTEGVVVNLNMLKLIFDKLAKVPGVSETLNRQLSPAFREKLAMPYTVLEPIDFDVNVVNGQLIFPELRITSTGFQLVGAGQVGLNGAVNFQATLFLDPELSGLLLSNVPQMQYVANAQGLIAVPVRLMGTVQNLSIEPDMDYIFQKVLFEKGQQLVGDVLGKALNTTNDAAQSGDSAYQNILGKLLQ